ncbi:hypothetical protein PHLCEN_2v9617 [Hermanssonia centrifuga]|uniref:DJ-1/PfpI domain-containing protein n=1 Tax=Hermanssonia centrifuga TaxID=98765 RepID=A0A2R6NQD3_9APHY|nr:hypothetical protein PHLCEN_2v9617 [Hermanssonia centrifuga]
MTITLSLAVCLFPDVAVLDFAGPMELLSFISPKILASGLMTYETPYTIEPVYLSVSKEPVVSASGMVIVHNRTYDEVKADEQFDILLVPGGLGTDPEVCPKALLDFLQKQAPNAKYVLAVCTGSEVLAHAGLLAGKRATTNKSSFNRIKEHYAAQKIEWVPKARWVVDGRFWTSSGVTAGADMGYAFLEQLVGHDIANFVRGIVELSIHKEGDDEFAEFYGLV